MRAAWVHLPDALARAGSEAPGSAGGAGFGARIAPDTRRNEIDMYTQSRPHPRAGLAIGAVLLAGWLGAIGIAIANDDDTGASGSAGATPGGDVVDDESSGPGRAGPGFLRLSPTAIAAAASRP
jgi:hypothetical protein